jgi:hypothetical protein
VRARGGAPRVARFEHDVDASQSFFEPPFGAGDVARVPLDEAAALREERRPGGSAAAR